MLYNCLVPASNWKVHKFLQKLVKVKDGEQLGNVMFSGTHIKESSDAQQQPLLLAKVHNKSHWKMELAAERASYCFLLIAVSVLVREHTHYFHKAF